MYFFRDEKRTSSTMLRDQSVRLHVSLLTEYTMRMRRMVLRMVDQMFFLPMLLLFAIDTCYRWTVCYFPQDFHSIARMMRFGLPDVMSHTTQYSLKQVHVHKHTHTHCRDTFSRFRHDFPHDRMMKKGCFFAVKAPTQPVDRC